MKRVSGRMMYMKLDIDDDCVRPTSGMLERREGHVLDRSG